MRIEADGAYLMPVSFGQTRPLKAGIFEDVWSLSTLYATDKDAIAALLPAPFEPADEPIVTMYYGKCSNVNFLAGGGYNLMGLNLAAYFNGKQDQVRGDYALVLWENDTHPIIRGRELLGVPKLFGDIPDPYRIGDTWRVQTSENGHLLLEMRIENVHPLSDQAIDQTKADGKEKHWMSWRYFPNVSGFGAALSQATLIGRESVVGEAWAGEGSVRYGDVTWDSNPMSADILAAVKRLVVKEYVGSTVTRGSMTITRALNRVLQ